MKPRLLDLFSGAGGSARGYQHAGFHVTGVDLAPMPRYAGDTFVQADALTYPLDGFDAVHASPPCHDHTPLAARTGGDGTGWMLTATIDRLRNLNVPWVVENVAFARFATDLRVVQLCGSSMGCWRLRRHRWFAGDVPTLVPGCEHWRWCGLPPIGVYGDGGKKGTRGYRGTAAERRQAMGIEWMSRAELSQAIPPAYTKFIGAHLLDAVRARQAVTP